MFKKLVKSITSIFTNSTKQEIAPVTAHPQSEIKIKSDEQYSEELVDLLLEVLEKNQYFLNLYLFGSRARSDHKSNSDHDFMVVFDSKSPESYQNGHLDNWKILHEIKSELAEKGFTDHIDIFTNLKHKFDAAKHQQGSLSYQCLDYGIQFK
ncbi:hypothetical protein ALTERO38_52189 [Alteromonas sp. 38]|uniref:nucleotidyltransferase domain-containing protein n=1 Tax=unclassified Alteromonas TaxID=2614992 RepID=UPI0012F20531|nr:MULTISPECIES: nucleotidyltransferase domain-containing protein [unclassified Alteromonas]CAD5268580.1 hypothetical protein ALTER154_50038 [Alteromonas sp. 154]VXC02289.1 hypothetical protein ALTERO38_52189 [Alteromonas sp. 38]